MLNILMTLFWLITALSFILSYVFKLIGDAYFREPIRVIGDFARLYLTHNEGVAFSLNFGSVLQLPLILLAFVLVLFLALNSAKTAWHQWGFGLIIGGALGNIVDRIPDGVVTDFIRVGSFPVFNVADSCITVGACLLLIAFLKERKANT
jgi:signal peptidase II